MYCMSLFSLVLLMETANYLFISSIPPPCCCQIRRNTCLPKCLNEICITDLFSKMYIERSYILNKVLCTLRCREERGRFPVPRICRWESRYYDVINPVRLLHGKKLNQFQNWTNFKVLQKSIGCASIYQTDLNQL